MNNSRLEEEREKLRAESLKWHTRMSRLFAEDRLAFERERKRLLDEFFNGIEDEDQRRRLCALQASFDQKMNHAGSAHNRFVLAQTMFWNHFHNIWQPGIRKMSALLKSFVGKAEDSTTTTQMATVYDIDKYRLP